MLIIFFSIIIALAFQPATVMAGEIDTGTAYENVIDDNDDLSVEIPDADEEQPEEEVTEKDSPEDEIPEEEPSSEDEIFLGEDIVDKLREDNADTVDTEETVSTEESTDYRKLPQTGESEELFVWIGLFLFCAFCMTLLIAHAFRLNFRVKRYKKCL
jgi:LPXTG-motif cell wall-anchored protein